MTNIKILNLTKVYGQTDAGVAAVNGVSLDIAGGEFFFLLGPSGCGKSTLLRMVAGLVTPTAGRVFFNDKDVTALAVEQRNTAMVFQNYALWPHMTVMENVEFGPRMRNCPPDKRRELALTNLARVQMEGLGKRKPSQLSGGQQQRVALARALAAQSSCLLLDEPLSNLDARLRQHMRGELRGLVKSTGVTALYVTHDQTEALSMADRIAVMNAGQIVQVGTPEELYERPATHFVADFLGEANFLPGKVLSAADGLAAIETPAGIVQSRGAAPAVGASVTCCIRPEWIALEPSPSAPCALPPSTLHARIEGCTYLGAMRQFVCRLSDGTTWKVTQLGALSSAPAVGAEVLLQADPARVTVLIA
jgi:ABC-type Fe3+/spermidine/putrescine transport system ATPase subunit